MDLGFDCVPLVDFPAIVPTAWFTRRAGDENANSDFGQLSLYAWDGHFYRVVEAAALLSRLWWYMIALNDDKITYYGHASTIEAKLSRYFPEVANGLLVLPSGLLLENNVDVEI